MPRTLVSTVVWRVLSIPIFFKILGIGALVAILFGGVTLIQTQAGASQFLYGLLEQASLSTARMLVDTIEAHATPDDLPNIMEHVGDVKEAFPEIRYILLLDHDDGIVGSTFREEVPPGLRRDFPPPNRFECGLRTVDSREGQVVEVRCPVAGVGSVQLGILDLTVAQRLAALRGSILRALAWCMVLGAGLALLLTHILTRPIRHLVDSANRIRDGEFEARARIFSNDEVGRLAVAFNQMAAGLLQYRQEVEAKEKVRLSLIEQIVQAQENERTSISRELHDHLGQSLLALLLQVQSGRDRSGPSASIFQHIEATILQVIDEVRRLAGGMRPSILDDYGLDSALARHVEEVTQVSGLNIDYEFTCPPGLKRLPIRIEVPLFRIAQEALANVVRHANAPHASVILIRQLRDVTLLIEDNGQGFDLAIAQERGEKCIGLIGMQERVALLGGDFLIQSVPREGTTIRVRIPLSEDADAHTDLDRG
jgi:signal transduction histidine kinase